MKQTAVEWYSNQLARIGVTKELIGHLTKEAKAMEKEQIEKAFNLGYDQWTVKTSEQYYNETFKPKQR